MKNLEDILKRCMQACSENKPRERFLSECELIVCQIFTHSDLLRKEQERPADRYDLWQERCERAEARIDKLLDALNTWKP